MTTTTQTSAVPPALPGYSPKADFGDWLSPMVVKELRQGTRSRNFVTIFLLLQGLLIISMLIGLGTGKSDTGFANGLYWTLLTVPLAILMPLSGLGALSQEVSENTLDLVLLTRLSPRRVVIGKCLGICLQSALMVTTILPYAVLRYFLGSINIIGELMAIVWLLLASVIFTVMAVGLSAYLSRVGRILVITGFIVGLLSASSGFSRYFFGMHRSPFSSGGVHSMDPWLVLGTFLPVLLILAIEFGASKIAPGTGNYAMVKRLCALALIVFAAFLPLTGDSIPTYRIFAYVLIGFICLNALLEPISEIPGVYRTLAKHGPPGRMLGRIFYPGWPSGVVFTLIALPAALSLVVFAPEIWDEKRGVLALTCLAGALLLPVAVQRLFFPRIRRPIVVFFVMQIIMVMVSIVAGSISGATGEKPGWMLLPFPMAQFIMAVADWLNTDTLGLQTTATLGVSAGSALFLLFCAIRAFKRIGVIEQRAATEKSTLTA